MFLLEYTDYNKYIFKVGVQFYSYPAAWRNILIEFLPTTGSLAIFFFLFINYIASKTNTDTLELPSVDLLPE